MASKKAIDISDSVDTALDQLATSKGSTKEEVLAEIVGVRSRRVQKEAFTLLKDLQRQIRRGDPDALAKALTLKN